MNKKRIRFVLALGAAFLIGCGPKVQVPPRVDLHAYQTIGFIDFQSKTEGNFDAYLNARFLEEISYAQPGLEIIELGSMDSVLSEIGFERLDRSAVQEIGKTYGADALIVGTLDISSIKPRLHLLRILSDVTVSAEVEAKIKARLIDTERGVTRWTAVAHDHKNVGFLTAGAGRPFFLHARNPDKAYGDLVDTIIFKVTRDLRFRYVRR